jgi:DNA-binding response OmpR family regulator
MGQLLLIAPRGKQRLQWLGWLQQSGYQVQCLSAHELNSAALANTKAVICLARHLCLVPRQRWQKRLASRPQLWMLDHPHQQAQIPPPSSLAPRLYLYAPYTPTALIAAVDQLLSATQQTGPAAELWKIHDWTLRLPLRRLEHADGLVLRLSETEAALLRYLLVHRHRVISREELLRQVWGIPTEGLTTRTVDMHIARLRAKFRLPASGLEASAAIVTVRNHGYQAGPSWQTMYCPSVGLTHSY